MVTLSLVNLRSRGHPFKLPGMETPKGSVSSSPCWLGQAPEACTGVFMASWLRSNGVVLSCLFPEGMGCYQIERCFLSYKPQSRRLLGPWGQGSHPKCRPSMFPFENQSCLLLKDRETKLRRTMSLETEIQCCQNVSTP